MPDIATFPEVHGHRGCRGLRPENTLAAFRHAVSLGVDVLELDVVVSADHQVVVSHEPWMSATICRTPAGEAITRAEQLRHNLYAMPYALIRQYDCGLTQHPAYPEQVPGPAHKPLLREVVAAADAAARQQGRAPVRFSVELKSTPEGDTLFHPTPAVFLALVLAELQVLGIASRTTLLCFDKRILQQVRQAAPGLPLCLLVEDTKPLGAHLAELGFLPEVVGPDFRLLTPSLVANLREAGLSFVPWTVNEMADLRAVLAYRPQGITTDFPDRLLALRTSFV
ncbi:glycerophosphoryl diester phosphodiesterase [Hymenobacter luteus]|uniref:Glycerophosphoryl diester phosphodiesterase n=2 Tax=Hymenobacter TaxID=89966 RepID=A0A7W9T541_9BACT|nr:MULTISPECIES: glycerophosphodiester phosphodiesterase family protein [Hymenobacter]MBB4603347.1 glycerophosphoryl diester phosphodiesterase [Hymenobacter latericoloratus]MBB6061095.1 glycerophosphoryl diester phosphodiesterase [Hymenobacter luteus]